MGSPVHTMKPLPAFPCLILLLLLHLSHYQVGCDDQARQARVFESGDLSAALTNLTSNYFQLKAIIIWWLHLIFQTVGWVGCALIWNTLRPGVNDSDPNFHLTLTDGLLNTEFSSTNLALALGQWAFYFVFWFGLLVVFQSQTTPASRRTSLDTSEDILITVMDDLFRPHTIAKQTLLNTLGTLGGTVFMGLTSHLPDSDLQQTRRRDDWSYQHQQTAF